MMNVNPFSPVCNSSSAAQFSQENVAFLTPSLPQPLQPQLPFRPALGPLSILKPSSRENILISPPPCKTHKVGVNLFIFIFVLQLFTQGTSLKSNYCVLNTNCFPDLPPTPRNYQSPSRHWLHLNTGRFHIKPFYDYKGQNQSKCWYTCQGTLYIYM